VIKSASRSSITNDQKYRSMLAGSVPSSEYLIETRVLDSSVSSVTFENLAQYAGVYKHLQIVAVARSDRNETDSPMAVQFNGITSGYFWHELSSGSTSPVSGVATGQASMRMIRSPGATAGTSNFGPAIIDILDAYSSNKNKTLRCLTGMTSSSYSRVIMHSGSVASTSPISEIKVIDPFGNMVAGSRFSLYGVTA
jgi:hypothetical protein